MWYIPAVINRVILVAAFDQAIPAASGHLAMLAAAKARLRLSCTYMYSAKRAKDAQPRRR